MSAISQSSAYSSKMNEKFIAEEANRRRAEVLRQFPPNSALGESSARTEVQTEIASPAISGAIDFSAVLMFFFFGFIAVLTLFALTSTAIDILEASRAKNWPVTQGVVLVSEARMDPRGRYLPSLRYRYTVAGRVYVGQRIAIGPQVLGGKERAAFLAALYPVGKNIPVFFNPERPDESALAVERMAEGVWLMFTFAPLMLILATIITYFQARKIFRALSRAGKQGLEAS